MTRKNGPGTLAGHVEDIRAALKSGATVKALATKYNVSLMAIRYVQSGKSYAVPAASAVPEVKVATMKRKSPGHLAPHIEAIRAAFAAGKSTNEVAREFEATTAAVRAIRKGEHYADGSTKAWERTPATPKAKPPPAPKPETKLDRAVRHWLKNPEMEPGEVAAMYGVSVSWLTERRKAAEGQAR